MPDEIKIDASSFEKFARDLKDAEKELNRQLPRNMGIAGVALAADARARARFSRRIPGAVRLRAARGGAFVYVDRGAAPHAAALEHGGQGGMFSHPVFGTSTWADQRAHPFFGPAVDDNQKVAVAQAERAVDRALSEVHSHA